MDSTTEATVEEERIDEVSRLEQRVRDGGLEESVEKHRGGESSKALLERFLTANKGDIDAAVSMLEEDLKWREQMEIGKLASMTSVEVLESLQCAQAKPSLDKILPHGFLGFDRIGRPVTYRKITSEFDAGKLDELGFDGDANAKYNSWMLERTCKGMGDRGQWVVLVDMADWSIFQFTPRNMGWANAISELITKHYPERMGKTFIINAPYVFGACWQVAKGWLDERTVDKIAIYSGPDQWRGELEKEMSLALLPEELGGEATPSALAQSFDPAVLQQN